MCDRHGSYKAQDVFTATVECVLLDEGTDRIDCRELAGAVQLILDGLVAELARDRNAVCYRVQLARNNGNSGAAIVKAPRMGPQRTNADTTFGWEAGIMALLPAKGITGAPLLLGRVAAAGTHFLFMNEARGRHPDPWNNPLEGQQLRAILDHLYVMDSQGFMHYDLKFANILVEGEHVAFIDFEFARFWDYRNVYTPLNEAFCVDFNVSSNPFFPTRSNVANFEFRALHRYLCDVAATQSSANVRLLDWLRGKSTYHRKMAGFFMELAETSVRHIALTSAVTLDEARGRLCAAAAHESMLAGLFEQPHAAVARVERLLMAFRCAVFERRAIRAQQLRRTIQAEIRTDSTHGEVMPRAYKKAIARVLDLVGRSVQPSLHVMTGLGTDQV
jgi:predicted Ser/Thr protein kinase